MVPSSPRARSRSRGASGGRGPVSVASSSRSRRAARDGPSGSPSPVTHSDTSPGARWDALQQLSDGQLHASSVHGARWCLRVHALRHEFVCGAQNGA
eukprot:15052565-Alexandrium_andersonii.AAC.1